MIKALSCLLLAVYAGNVLAFETLVPIRVPPQSDRGLILDKCQAAFQQIFADRLDVEGQERFVCLVSLHVPDLEAVHAGFMILCEKTVTDYDSASVEQLKFAFNSQYTPLIATKCEQRERQRIQAYNANQFSASGGGTLTWSSTSNGAGQAYREQCYRGSGCR